MNKHRGEFLLELDKVEYKLCYSINAICALEGITNKTVIEIGKILADPDNLSLTFARAFLWAGLQKYHSAITIQGAGDILEEHGAEKVIEKMVEGFATAFPSTSNNDHPTKERSPVGGNGTGSSLTGSNAV